MPPGEVDVGLTLGAFGQSLPVRDAAAAVLY